MYIWTRKRNTTTESDADDHTGMYKVWNEILSIGLVRYGSSSTTPGSGLASNLHLVV